MGFVLFKVKHNGSQWCCAISYLHWIVISIGCSTRLEVFQCPEIKNIRKIEDKKEQENHQICIDFKPIYRPQKVKQFFYGGSAPKHPCWGGLQSPQPLLLNLARFARLYRSPKYFPVLPPENPIKIIATSKAQSQYLKRNHKWTIWQILLMLIPHMIIERSIDILV